MAQLIINIPDAQATRVFNAVSARYGYAGQETQAQYVKKLFIAWIMDAVKVHETGIAARLATDTAEASVQTDITIT